MTPTLEDRITRAIVRDASAELQHPVPPEPVSAAVDQFSAAFLADTPDAPEEVATRIAARCVGLILAATSTPAGPQVSPRLWEAVYDAAYEEITRTTR